MNSALNTESFLFNPVIQNNKDQRDAGALSSFFMFMMHHMHALFGMFWPQGQ